jgi:flavin reductase (DIM6/NTAB) family NADH-FMN oxidoreductase RutF
VPIGPEAFRDALRLFPSGVTLVTLRAQGRVHGLTVSAFASISPAPPLVGVFIDDQHGAHALLESPGACFAVNILAEDQRRLAEVFAWSPDDERFDAGAWGTAVTGAPVLTDACAWLDCTLHSRHAAGGHTLYVGRVEASATPRAGSPPLVYWNRGYRQLAGEGG